MADFDEKLNQILSNPDAMAQIARLAQSLDAPPNASDAAESRDDASATSVTSAAVPVPDGGNSVAQFLPLLQELGGDSNARQLLYALRPYLRPQKQEKVERALRLARLFRVGKQFLSQWEG